MAELTYMQFYHSYLDAIELLGDAERGRLFTACLQYSKTGAAPELGGNERFVFPMIRAQIDRDKAAYDEKCRLQSEKGKLGGRPKKSNSFSGNPELFEKAEKAKEKEKEKEKEGNSADAPTGEEKHKRGQFGWVRLSESEYQRLISEFGESAAQFYIAYVDESAQQTGNKNKWKDWNLTVRKAIRNKWGGDPPQESRWKSLD